MRIFDLQVHFQSEKILLKVHTEVGGHCLEALGGVTVETFGFGLVSLKKQNTFSQ